MAKLTLLEIVQNILSALDSDEVNDINDTIESAQVAEVVKETFYEQFNNITRPNSKSLLRLDGISNTDSPNYMKFQSDVDNIDWVRYTNYRNDNKMEFVYFVAPEEFLEIVLNNTSTSENVVSTIDPTTGISYYIKNNSVPHYYTSFDNKYLAFDSYDSENETTLHTAKSLAYGTKTHSFEMSNDFIPDIPDNLFPLLLAESKAVCFINQKQIASTKEEQRAHRQRIRMQNDQFKSKTQQRRHISDAPNYSRTPPR